MMNLNRIATVHTPRNRPMTFHTGVAFNIRHQRIVRAEIVCTKIVRTEIVCAKIARATALTFILMLLFGFAPLQAQETGSDTKDAPISAGVLGGFSFNLYSGSLDVGSNVFLGGGACGVLGTGTGSGAGFGAFAEYKLSPSFALGLRGLLENRSGQMTADAPTTQRRGNNGELETIESTHHFEVDLQTPSIELYGLLSPFSFPLRFSFGPKIGIASNPTYEFAEELPEGNELAFANGTKREVFASGQLSSSTLFGLGAGVGYQLPMGGGFDLLPELFLSTYFNGLISEQSAPMIAGVRSSVSLRYTFAKPQPAPPIAEIIEPTPPPPPPAPKLSASITAQGLNENGTVQNDLLVVVEERVRRREIALLPYVFFDRNSAEVPGRYLNRKASSTNIVNRYRDVLDLLGERMKAQPKTTVTLTGTNSNTGPERENTELSRARAEAVKNYLTGKWGIASSRIVVNARNLPEAPSNNSWPGGQEENQRVEIDGDSALMAPLTVEDTIRTYSSPGLRLESAIQFDVPFNFWDVRLALGERTIRSLKGGEILKNQIDEQLTENELQSIAEGKKVFYGILVRDESGQEFATEPESIETTVQYKRTEDMMLNDTTISVATPVLFAYNSADLDKRGWEALTRLRNILPSGSKLTITGYADSLGESGYNRTLSERRAQTVAKIFDNFTTTIIAAGERTDVIADNTPESRFYARTVTVEVERNSKGGMRN